MGGLGRGLARAVMCRSRVALAGSVAARLELELAPIQAITSLVPLPPTAALRSCSLRFLSPPLAPAPLPPPPVLPSTGPPPPVAPPADLQRSASPRGLFGSEIRKLRVQDSNRAPAICPCAAIRRVATTPRPVFVLSSLLRAPSRRYGAPRPVS